MSVGDTDLAKRWNRAIDRAGLVNDPYGEVLSLLPEVLAELRAARNAPLDPRIIRQVARATMSSEERRRWMIGGAVIAAVLIVLSGTAGWALHQPDVCLAITR